MTHDEFDDIATLEALGAATQDEIAALDAHEGGCEACAAIRSEYAEATALIAGSLAPIAPPAHIRSTLLANVRSEASSVIEPDPSVWLPSRRWFAAAAMLFFALWVWREFVVHVTKVHLRSQAAEIKDLTEQNEALKKQRERLASTVASIASPGTRSIELAGQQAAPSASARLFLPPHSDHAVIFFADLPPTPPDHCYQLWVLGDPQAAPQSAGTFQAGSDGRATMVIDTMPGATGMKAIAVTMEPKGGMPRPSNTNFILMGHA